MPAPLFCESCQGYFCAKHSDRRKHDYVKDGLTIAPCRLIDRGSDESDPEDVDEERKTTPSPSLMSDVSSQGLPSPGEFSARMDLVQSVPEHHHRCPTCTQVTSDDFERCPECRALGVTMESLKHL